jgi:peptidoglycan hydrolase-like protein with peptidoglycan-binding domain
MLRLGSFGASVRSVQSLLNAIEHSRYPPLAVDGVFGPLTHRRVVEFQTSLPKALSGDGIVGPLTSTKLIASIFSDDSRLIPLFLSPMRGPLQPFARLMAAPTPPDASRWS